MAVNTLRIGDIICLYSEEVFGFLSSYLSSNVHCELAVKPKENRDKPSVPDPQVISLQICVANRYKLNKKFRKIINKSMDDPGDILLKTQASQAQIGSDAEHEDNIAEQHRQHGKKLLYGQIVQLKHSFTGKFIHVSTTQTSKTETSNMQVILSEFNAKHAQFRIMPRYKVKAEGDVVQVDDQIVLESVKSPGQFVHISQTHFESSSVYSESHEVNLSVRQSGFTIYRRYKPEKEHFNCLQAGAPIRLFHKEIEAYLVAEGIFGEEIIEDVHLRVRPMDQNNPKTLFPSTSAITYWQIELNEKGAVNGSVVKWEQQCRLKHLTTRKYLKIDNTKVCLTDDNVDPKAVFTLHPVIKEKEEIEFDTYCRVQHAVSGTWLHATNGEYARQSKSEGKLETSMASLEWTSAPLMKIEVSEEMQYDDAFTLQKVDEESLQNFNFMAGMVPFIQKLLLESKTGLRLNAKQGHDLGLALTELKEFMIVNSEPKKERQKLLRNLRIVELLVSLLQRSNAGTKENEVHLTKVMVECYDVLYTYLMGDSRKNELYIAKHIDFFESQISYKGDIGLNAAHMVMELVKDNRKIVDRITHQHIDHFVNLLVKKKNYRYLDLLSVLCVCDGVSIPDNQKYITEAWLMKGAQNGVYYTDLGQAIGKESGVVYVSINNKESWISLLQFVQNRAIDNEEFLFLDHQLDLFGKICFGKNDFAIKVITDQLKYLTWDEAYLCLTNKEIPDQLRAKYCHLIIALFIDIGESTTALDRVNLTFCYDDIGNKTNSDQLNKPVVNHTSSSKQHFVILKSWISKFLESNKAMTASLIGHNMLVEQVLRLVHYLAKHGFYGDMEDIKQLLDPLLSLLDGTNDLPFPNIKESAVGDVLRRYRNELRYKQSPETKAIVDAKFQALEVLALFFNYKSNVLLEKFVEEYKGTFAQAHHISGSNPKLGVLLQEDFFLEQNQGMISTVKSHLHEMLAESSFFKGYPLSDVLLDLSKYDYDKMVVKSMTLLDHNYSTHDNLFKRAVQAQVLITDSSVKVLSELQSVLPTMQQLKSAKMTQDQIKTMAAILDKLKSFCHLDNEPEEEHPMNQNILYNHDVLATVFDILSQELDIRLMDQYSGIKSIFQKAFELLKAMTKGNEVVQQRMFDRLDVLLGIKGAEAQMAESLIEVFTGNKETCMKVLSYQIQKIMSLVAQHGNNVPRFLDLLNAIVKVEDLNLPLKRNQGYVMKYFMQYRNEVGYVLDKPNDERQKLLTSKEEADYDYLISLVDLLATCAEGENRFIESICQTIFGITEIIDILNNEEVDGNVKRPFLRFFLWVYLNTASGMIESGAGDLPHDSKVWQYMNSLNADLKMIATYAENNPETMKQLLKIPAGKSLDSLVDQVMGDPERLNQFLGESGQAEWKTYLGKVHYFLDAVFPFLQVFFRTYYQPDQEIYPQEADHLDQLANSLVGFIKNIGPLVSNPTHMKSMIGCMNVVLSTATVPVKMMEEFQEKYGGVATSKDLRSDARKKYEEEYQSEEELNAQLNIFAVNYSISYGGLNDVKTQINFNSRKDYTELGSDEELPLGQEFQEHILCFVDTSDEEGDRYQMASKLVQQLAISANTHHTVEKDRMEQETIDIKCLLLLRGLIHNEIVKLPDDWESNIKENNRLLRRIEEVQNALNSYGAMLDVLPQLSKTRDDIIREVLAFLAAMLFGGNNNVQQGLCEYFLGTREEKFFFAVKNRMQLSSIAIKEKRSLIAQQQAKIEEATEQAKALRKAMRTGQIAAQEIMAANPLGSALLNLAMSKQNMQQYHASNLLKKKYGSHSNIRSQKSKGSRLQLGIHGALIPPEITISTSFVGSHPSDNKADNIDRIKLGIRSKENKIAPVESSSLAHFQDIEDDDLQDIAALSLDIDGNIEYRDDGYIKLVLKILGLMCDGQNKTLQDYLREQPDNIKSLNLVSETAKFLSLVYSNISSKTISLVTEIFNTLVEFTSGNQPNQVVVFDNKICDYINFILRGANFSGSSRSEVLDLKKSIGTLIVAMVEENAKEMESTKTSTIGIAQEVSESLDVDGLWGIAVECYHESNENSDSSKLADDVMELNEAVGFSYFHIILRVFDINENSSQRKKKLLKTQEDEDIWRFYARGTLSVEVLKDAELQKINFRCRDKTVLREDVKELFKYEVDRSSPSNKLREFMDWSKDIMADIKYTRKVLSNPISRLFVKQWWNCNIGMIIVSFLFFLLTLITWREPLLPDGSPNVNSSVPRYAYSEDGVRITTYVLGGIHNIFALCTLISYFITNHPTFPHFRYIRKIYSKLTAGNDDSDEGEDRESNLEVKFFSFKTFYYILLFGFSVLGTAFYGYFFSFHLLHMAEFNQLLKRAIQAVTKNGTSLMWVFFFFGIVCIWIFALIAFAFYRELFDSDSGLHCRNMYECFVVNVHRGLIIGIYEFLGVPEGKPFTYHLHKAVFDLSFFIIITTIGLNIIFGIIVDTFSELRDNKWNVDQDMHTTCFICSRSSYDFEHQGGGFDAHVRLDHNQWAYLFFFIHLDETRCNDYTALELYVFNQLAEENYDFFPLNRALSLQHDEDDNQVRLEVLMQQVSYLVDKMKEKEITRERLEEKKRQGEWELKHRH